MPARVEGWRRGFFIYSTHHRGTHARPGLVLALDRGGACIGLAFRDRRRSGRRPRSPICGRASRSTASTASSRWRRGSRTARGRRVEAIAYVAERSASELCRPAAAVQAGPPDPGCRGHLGPQPALPHQHRPPARALGVREQELSRLMALAGPHLARARLRRTNCSAPTQALMHHCLADRVKVPLMRKGERRRFVYRLQMAEWSRARRSDELTARLAVGGDARHYLLRHIPNIVRRIASTLRQNSTRSAIMKVLVTGANGHLGTNLVADLLAPVTRCAAPCASSATRHAPRTCGRWGRSSWSRPISTTRPACAPRWMARMPLIHTAAVYALYAPGRDERDHLAPASTASRRRCGRPRMPA